MVGINTSLHANLKTFGFFRSPNPKKIKPFNIVYVNFHCPSRDRLLECFMVEGAVPLFWSVTSEPWAEWVIPFRAPDR